MLIHVCQSMSFCLSTTNNMKTIVIVLLLFVGVIAAEPLRKNGFQRQEEEKMSGPYPESGYRPSGAEFNLPERQVEARTKYGPPTEEPTTTDSSADDTTIESTTAENQSGQLNKKEAKPVEDVEQVEAHPQPKQHGLYFVLLPTGRLQRVQYFTSDDDNRKNAYATQVQYANADPTDITGPIYAFNPNSPFLQLVYSQ